MTSELDSQLAELHARGFVVLEAVYDSAFTGRWREVLTAVYRELGEPSLCSNQPSSIAHTGLTSSGLVIHRLLDHAPELVQGFIHPRVAELVRAALGPDAVVEATAGMISDSSRQMHPWHHHVGGMDEDLPDQDPGDPMKLFRLTMLVYLDRIDEPNGQLLVYPRKLGDPLTPPIRSLRVPWDGQVALSCPAGTAVLLDERTWHAAMPRRAPGLRMFVGGFFASGSARADASSDALDGLLMPTTT